MGIKTAIEWCDSSINPMMGCDGCELWNKKVKTCYSGVMTGRYAGKKGWPASFDEPEIFPGRIEKACGWADLTGTKRPNKPWLDGMPRMVFLNDMGDTFTESLPIDWLIPYVLMMAESPHIWMFLTKRVKRMTKFFQVMGVVPDNFWLGTTVTNQATAVARVPELVKIPTSVRFLSIEPLLGPVDLYDWFHEIDEGLGHDFNAGIDWVIVGGESGPDARPMNPPWARSIRDQCRNGGIPFFFKQWGEFRPHGFPDVVDGPPCLLRFSDGSEHGFVKVGKHVAGRLLDGREWTQMPEVKR